MRPISPIPLLLLAACGSSTREASNPQDASDGDAALEAGADSPADTAHADADATADADAKADAAADAGVTKHLIKHGQDIPTPTFVHDHVAEMEAMPFDGVVVSIPSSTNVQRTTALAPSEVASELAPMKTTTFTTLSHDFVMVHATPAGASWFDDDAAPTANFDVLATAARDARLTGIVYDQEAYFGAMWDATSQCGGQGLVACAARVHDVGKHAMAAVIAAWPDAIVLTLYGPWVSEPKTAAYFAGHFPYNDVSSANPLMGPFFLGMAEAAVGTHAKLIDGGEMYTERDSSQFARAYTWQKTEFAIQSPLVSPTLAPAYSKTVDVSAGVYDLPWEGAPMDPSIVQTTIANAMHASDGWVWFYTEGYDWWGTHNDPVPLVPKAWIDAVAAGRDAGAH